jgi:hypothetical protein
MKNALPIWNAFTTSDAKKPERIYSQFAVLLHYKPFVCHHVDYLFSQSLKTLKYVR